MWEVKLIPTTIVGKPAMAIVLGSVIIAEPDAKRGVYWEDTSSNPVYAIIHSTEMEKFTELIRRLNAHGGKSQGEKAMTQQALFNDVSQFNFSQQVREFWFSK